MLLTNDTLINNFIGILAYTSKIWREQDTYLGILKSTDFVLCFLDDIDRESKKDENKYRKSESILVH